MTGRPIAFVLIVLAVLTLGAVHPAQAEVQVEEVVSPGGITAWLVRDDTVPVTAIEFSFKGGGAGLDPEGKEGTANLVASTIDEGSGPYDSKTYQQRLADQSIRISFSAGRDAFSGSFYTLNRYRDDALELLRLALTEPRFDSEPVERIRSQIMVGIRQSESDPESRGGKALREAVFGDHPYADPVEGSEDSLAAISVDDMRRFLAEALTRDRLTIGVVGDIEPVELGAALDRVFGALPETGRVDPTPDIDPEITGKTVVVEMDIPQSTILFAQRGLQIDDPQYYAGMVLNYVIGGGSFSSVLTDEIRVKRGLVYSVYSFLHPMDHAALLRGGAATQNARVGETIGLIRSVLKDIRDNGVSSEKIADAKTYLTGSFPLRFTNSSQIAAQLDAMQYHGFPIDYFQTRNAQVEAVSDEDVNRLADEWLDPDNLLFVVVGKPEGIGG